MRRCTKSRQRSVLLSTSTQQTGLFKCPSLRKPHRKRLKTVKINAVRRVIVVSDGRNVRFTANEKHIVRSDVSKYEEIPFIQTTFSGTGILTFSFNERSNKKVNKYT